MNREQLNAFIADMIKMRNAATDELAIDAPCVYPQWDGEGVYYEVGDRVLYNDILYKVLIAHTSQLDWTPTASPSLFAKVLTDDNKILPWEQPDSTNPYMIGDKVTHNDYIWTSIVDNNVWEPGVYGWEQGEEADISDAEALSIITGGNA